MPVTPVGIGLIPPVEQFSPGGLNADAAGGAAVNAALLALGTGVAFGPSAVGMMLKVVRVEPTVGQLQALNGTPIDIISDPVGGKLVLPLWWTWEMQTAGQGISTAPNATLRYRTLPAVAVSGTIAGGVNNVNIYTLYAQPIASGTGIGFANPSGTTPLIVGSGMRLHGSNMTGGTGSSHAITVGYLEFTPGIT